jgi:hypothetical protein
MQKSFILRPEKQKEGWQLERKKIESFEDLLVWQKGINLIRQVYLLFCLFALSPFSPFASSFLLP